MTPTLLTPLEAGEILRCSAGTIKRYVRQGELQAFRHRGRVLIPAEAIERFVGEHLTAIDNLREHAPRRARRRVSQDQRGYQPGARLVEFSSRKQNG